MEAERCPFNGVDCEYIPLAKKAAEQAKEIERLREALKEIHKTTWELDIKKIARAALEEKE